MAQPTAKAKCPPTTPTSKAVTKPKAKIPWEAKFDASRTTGPDTRDPRCAGAPCYGNHTVAKAGRGSPTGSNAHGAWEGCEKCLLRLSYTPAWGAHALHRKSGPLPSDTSEMVAKVGPNNAGYNEKLKDRSIALDAAETSAEKKLEQVRAMKAQWQKQQQKEEDKNLNSTGQSEVPPRPQTPVPHPSEEMGTTPGRKTRKQDQTAEELEYDNRSALSWSLAGTPPTSPP